MKDKVVLNHFYVFVNLNGDNMSEPEYFICTGKEAEEKVMQYTTRGIVNLNALDRAGFKNKWDKIK